MGKFRSLKIMLKGWNKHAFGDLDSKIESLKEVVANLNL